VITKEESLGIDLPPVSCFAAHRVLVGEAIALSQRLAHAAPYSSDGLRLGANCIRLSAEQALNARREQDAIRRWNECELGERQIRSNTFRALLAGHIDASVYDHIFAAGMHATRNRRDELTRLRRRIQRDAII
jgi:hypothetical protein